MTTTAKLKVFRGDEQGGELVDYEVPVDPGMVVLDAVHKVQKLHSPDLAVRWRKCRQTVLSTVWISQP